jgi:RimJ/RimL family protein N-acetyltransferase
MIWLKKDTDGSVFKWVKENLKDRDEFNNDLTIGIYFDKRLIAGIVFSIYSKYNVYLTIYTENKNWCTRRVINFIYKYCFDVLSVKKITCIADKSNRKIRRLLTKLGFRLEGVVKYGRLNGRPAFIFGLCFDDDARYKFTKYYKELKNGRRRKSTKTT